MCVYEWLTEFLTDNYWSSWKLNDYSTHYHKSEACCSQVSAVLLNLQWGLCSRVRLMMVSWEERLRSDILCVEWNTKLSTWWLLGARRYATKSTPASLVYGQQIWSITSRGLLQNSWNLLVLHRSAYQRCWHSLWMYCSDHSSSSFIRNSYC